MNTFKKYSLQLATASAALVVLLVMTPRAAHAVAAALVQVTNTIQNPVVTTDASKAASQLILLQEPGGSPIPAGQIIGLNLFSPTQGQSTTPYVVPAGQNLVVTGIDFNTYGASPNNFIYLRIPIGFGLNSPQTFTITTPGTHQFSFASGIVYPAGTSVSIHNVSGNDLDATVHGYLTAN
jgi:hypothetical protein